MKKNQHILIKKIVINDVSYLSLVAVYQMLGNSKENIDKFNKVLWKNKVYLKKYYFLNGNESVELLEKPLLDNEIDFNFKHRFWGDWDILRISDPHKYGGFKNFFKRFTRTSWDEINFFGFFQLEKEFVNIVSGRMCHF